MFVLTDGAKLLSTKLMPCPPITDLVPGFFIPVSLWEGTITPSHAHTFWSSEHLCIHLCFLFCLPCSGPAPS